MQKQVYKVDESGYLQEILVKEFSEHGDCTEELAENIIVTDVPRGLYRARWNGTEWIEDMAQEEIDELNKQPILPSAEERIDMLENMILMMMEG